MKDYSLKQKKAMLDRRNDILILKVSGHNEFLYSEKLQKQMALLSDGDFLSFKKK